MTGSDGVASATRVVLRPIATPLPLGFLALTLATTTFAVVQLGWLPVSQERIAGLTALAAAAPLQAIAAVFGFLARDPVAGTGMAVQAGTWGLLGLVTVTSPPGSSSSGLGVLLITAGVVLLVPSLSGKGKIAAAAVMALTGARFAVTGIYELTAAPQWETAAGAVGLAVAAAAVYAALALEVEGAFRHIVLPVGRSGLAREAVRGEGVLDGEELAREPGIRPRL